MGVGKIHVHNSSKIVESGMLYVAHVMNGHAVLHLKIVNEMTQLKFAKVVVIAHVQMNTKIVSTFKTKTIPFLN